MSGHVIQAGAGEGAKAVVDFSPPVDNFPRTNAIDFDPDSGILFAARNDGEGSDSENYLATVNIVTGAVTIIGPTVDGLDALAFLPTLEPLNQPPELAPIGDQTVNEGATAVIAISASDADSDALTFVASGLPSFATFVDHGNGTVIGYQPSTNTDALTPTHVYSNTGTYTVKLTVRDDDGGVTSVTKQVTIKAVDIQVDPCDPTKTALVVGGTNGDDKIRFIPQGNKGEIKVLINGVSQGVFKPTGSIIAYGLDGNDDIEVAGSIGLAAILSGGNGNDRLKGGAGVSVLCGGDGDDLLIGGSGRSILIGDSGADRLVGNGGDDILIGGTTSYGCDTEVLCTILDTWTRRDLSYTQKVNYLSNGQFKLTAQTVFDDGAADMLTGSSGLDWFFSGLNDKITDRHPSEVSTTTDSLATLVTGSSKRWSI